MPERGKTRAAPAKPAARTAKSATPRRIAAAATGAAAKAPAVKKPVVKKPAVRKASSVARMSLDAVRTIVAALPAVEEGTSYGTPAFRVRGKLFARQHENPDWLVVRIEMDAREIRTGMDPETFFFTDHYRHYPMMLVSLSRVARADLVALLEQSWRLAAPPRLLAQLDGHPR